MCYKKRTQDKYLALLLSPTWGKEAMTMWRFQCGWRSGVWSGASESDSGDGLEPVSEKAPMLCQGLQILSYGKEGGRKVLD